MERKEKNRSGQSDQSQQKNPQQGGSKENIEPEQTRRGTEQGTGVGVGEQGGRQGFDQDISRRDTEETTRREGNTGTGGVNEETRQGSSRQGLGESGRSGSSGRRSS